MVELELSELEADVLYAVIDKFIYDLDNQIEYESEPAIIEAALFEQDQLRAIKQKLESVSE